MTENQTAGTGKHAAPDETETILSIKKRPHRSLVSLNNDDDMAMLRITPRVKRNARRIAAVGAVAVVSPPMAAATALVGAFQSWQDYSNSTEAKQRRGEIEIDAETTESK
jgi:hypothetical protein